MILLLLHEFQMRWMILWMRDTVQGQVSQMDLSQVCCGSAVVCCDGRRDLVVLVRENDSVDSLVFSGEKSSTERAYGGG